jgi:hypothetical protein
MRESTREVKELDRAQEQAAASAIRPTMAELQFTLSLERLGIVGQRDLSFLKAYTPDAEAATASTKHFTEARRALITLTQDLHRIEDAYGKALGVSNDQIGAATQAMVANLGVFIGAIAGRKAEAEVEGGFMCAEGAFDVARGIWPPNPQLIIKGMGEIGAGIQMLEVAGKSGRHPSAVGGGAGGARSEYERGGYGGGGYGSEGGPPTGFGLAPGAQGSGGGRLNVYVVGDEARFIAERVNAADQAGHFMQVTSSRRSAPAQG